MDKVEREKTDDSEGIKLSFFSNYVWSRGTVMRILIPTLLVRPGTLNFIYKKVCGHSENSLVYENINFPIIYDPFCSAHRVPENES